MKPENDRTEASPAKPAPRKRFRLQKLEDRIAPKKGGNYTHKGCSSGTISYTGTY